MNKLLLALMSAFVVFATGCAGTGTTMAAGPADGGLPEIAAYDEMGVSALPAHVPSQTW